MINKIFEINYKIIKIFTSISIINIIRKKEKEIFISKEEVRNLTTAILYQRPSS